MKLRTLSEPIVAIVHLADQPPHVLMQVTLDPAKIPPGSNLIRLGDFPGDEANCWRSLDAIEILHVLGKATYDAEKKQLTVTPFSEQEKAE